MDKFLLVANWKANIVDAKTWIKELTIHGPSFISKEIEIAIAPAFPLISTFREQFQISNFKFQICSQDVSSYPAGAYTGEVPAKLLASMRVKYSLVGHSERRKHLHETNVEVEAKIRQAIESGVIPIICAQTLDEIPANIRNYPQDKFMLMYEPFSAISADGKYNPENPERVVATLTDWKTKLNLNCRFLYGGSVNPDDCSLLIAHCPLLSGLVVGHASLEADTFSAIIKKCLQNLG